jgi:DNA-binding NarL/FixJ family response regulator
MRTDRIPQAPEQPAAEVRGAIAILILSQIRFLRESLAEALQRDPLLSIAGLCADLADALLLLKQIEPDIVLLDAAFPNGTTVIRPIAALSPRAKVVVFAVTETEEHVVSWAEAGAAGYIPASAALGELVRLLIAIQQGEQACSGRVASALMRQIANAAKSNRGMPKLAPEPFLTVREKEIVRLVSIGMSNKEIARRLNIELSTTKSHVHNVLGKLHLQRRGQVGSWHRENIHNPSETQPV